VIPPFRDFHDLCQYNHKPNDRGRKCIESKNKYMRRKCDKYYTGRRVGGEKKGGRERERQGFECPIFPVVQ